jgi:hypothetical protein
VSASRRGNIGKGSRASTLAKLIHSVAISFGRRSLAGFLRCLAYAPLTLLSGSP